MTRPLALIVDDEAGILSTLGGILTDNGFEVATTPSGAEALDIYAARHPEVVFLDVWLPDRDGLETLPDGEFLPAWEMNDVEKHVGAKITGAVR